MTETTFPEFPGKESVIHFFSEDTDFEYPAIDWIQTWIKKVITQENCFIDGDINFIFCSDNYLYQLNVDYLNHDTLTDIITFPYSPPPHISGDIFISIDRVRDNAASFEVSFQTELHRVMIHGILHLCGYLDKKAEDEKRMRTKEDEALRLLLKLS